MKKIAAPVLSVMLLSGCAVPVAVTVASLVVDGISYVTTEKSLTDHGLSALSDSDCAMYRLITTGYVCHPHDIEDTVVAENSQAPIPPIQRTQNRYTTSAYQSVTDVVSVRDTSQQSVDTPAPGVYMVIVSGRDHRAAEDVAKQFAEISPRVFAQSAGPGQDIFRVVAGPITQAQYPAAQAYASKHGLFKVWALMIEDHDWRQGEIILANARQTTTETAFNQ
mgnify:FL=1|tara:strand:+ start:12096 stop:12761 length:666 start_codon:yes stop_codon:yes gene_type:complete